MVIRRKPRTKNWIKQSRLNKKVDNIGFTLKEISEKRIPFLKALIILLFVWIALTNLTMITLHKPAKFLRNKTTLESYTKTYCNSEYCADLFIQHEEGLLKNIVLLEVTETD